MNVFMSQYIRNLQIICMEDYACVSSCLSSLEECIKWDVSLLAFTGFMGYYSLWM